MSEDYWIEYEQKIRRTIFIIACFILLAILGILLPFTGIFKPSGQTLAAWWQRAGAPITVFSFLAQNKAQNLGALLTPGSFAIESFELLRKKYQKIHHVGFQIAVALTVMGTLVWGYGDLLIDTVLPRVNPATILDVTQHSDGIKMPLDKILNFISALIGAAGTFLMYKGTFGFAPVGAYMGAVSSEAIAANTRRARLQKYGLLFLIVSFTLQGIAQLIPSAQ